VLFFKWASLLGTKALVYLTEGHIAGVFVHAKPLQPSLMKDAPLKGILLSLLANIILGSRSVPGTTTLCYYFCGLIS